MKRTPSAIAGGMLALISAFAASGGGGGQQQAPVGYLPGDRVVAMAAAADASIASFTPSPEALASFVALVDPLHLRVFFRSAQPSDLTLAAKIARTVEGAANPALTAEFVAVSDDLAEPKGPIADNGVTKAPEIIVYWMGQEVGRMHPEPGAAIDSEELPISSTRPGPRSPRRCSSTTSSSSTLITRTFWSSTASAVTDHQGSDSWERPSEGPRSDSERRF